MLLLAGAGLVALSLILPHPSGGHFIALCATAAGMAVVGAAVWFLSARVPVALVHLLFGGHGVGHRRAGLGVRPRRRPLRDGLRLADAGRRLLLLAPDRRTHLGWLLRSTGARCLWSKAPPATRR